MRKVLVFLIFALFLINPYGVFAFDLVDFSLSDTVVANSEPLDIEFNITNTQNVLLGLYGYSTKGILEIFDEDSQKWLVSTTLPSATRIYTKAKIRLQNVENQETQLHFVLIDSKTGMSYESVAKSLWVGSYEADYINILNSGLLSAQSSSSVLNVSKPLTEESNFDEMESATSKDFSSEVYIGIGLIMCSYVIITLSAFVVIKYTNGSFKALDTSNTSNGDNISSLIDTWSNNS